jgi:hypothetical protein
MTQDRIVSMDQEGALEKRDMVLRDEYEKKAASYEKTKALFEQTERQKERLAAAKGEKYEAKPWTEQPPAAPAPTSKAFGGTGVQMQANASDGPSLFQGEPQQLGPNTLPNTGIKRSPQHLVSANDPRTKAIGNSEEGAPLPVAEERATAVDPATEEAAKQRMLAEQSQTTPEAQATPKTGPAATVNVVKPLVNENQTETNGITEIPVGPRVSFQIAEPPAAGNVTETFDIDGVQTKIAAVDQFEADRKAVAQFKTDLGTVKTYRGAPDSNLGEWLGDQIAQGKKLDIEQIGDDKNAKWTVYAGGEAYGTKNTAPDQKEGDAKLVPVELPNEVGKALQRTIASQDILRKYIAPKVKEAVTTQNVPNLPPPPSGVDPTAYNERAMKFFNDAGKSVAERKQLWPQEVEKMRKEYQNSPDAVAARKLGIEPPDTETQADTSGKAEAEFGELTTQQRALKGEIKELLKQYKSSKTPEVYQQLLAKQKELDKIEGEWSTKRKKAEKNMLPAMATHFGM